MSLASRRRWASYHIFLSPLLGWLLRVAHIRHQVPTGTSFPTSSFATYRPPVPTHSRSSPDLFKPPGATAYLLLSNVNFLERLPSVDLPFSSYFPLSQIERCNHRIEPIHRDVCKHGFVHPHPRRSRCNPSTAVDNCSRWTVQNTAKRLFVTKEQSSSLCVCPPTMSIVTCRGHEDDRLKRSNGN